MTTGLRCCLSARNIASPWPIGVRQSSSLWITISGVAILEANATGDRSRYSAGSSNGGLRNQNGVNMLKSVL